MFRQTCAFIAFNFPCYLPLYCCSLNPIVLADNFIDPGLITDITPNHHVKCKNCWRPQPDKVRHIISEAELSVGHSYSYIKKTCA
jgi:hypothetical protein